MISCLVHDIDHPGVNSDYLIKSGSSLALQFPYKNVLEQSNAIFGCCFAWARCIAAVIEMRKGKVHDAEVAREMASASLLHAILQTCPATSTRSLCYVLTWPAIASKHMASVHWHNAKKIFDDERTNILECVSPSEKVIRHARVRTLHPSTCTRLCAHANELASKARDYRPPTPGQNLEMLGPICQNESFGSCAIAPS